MLKKIRYLLEGVVVYILYGFFWVLPTRTASCIGGFIARNLGPNMAVSRKAYNHLKIAFPHINNQKSKKIICGMWDNLGRLMAEYPHLRNIEKKGLVTIHHENNLKKAELQNKPIIMVTGHYGNWEILPYIMNARLSIPLALIYRIPNNPWVRNLLKRARGKGTAHQIPKGPRGAKEMIKLARDGKHMGLLFDQKMNEGIPVPFFGRLAMTITSVAQLALKYDCIVLPAYAKRRDEDRAHFDVYIEEPFEIINTGHMSKDIETNMIRLNKKLEEWVRQKPDHWLWLHRRWPHKKEHFEKLKKKAG